MKFDGTTLWAICATAVALVLAGMHIERKSIALDTAINTAAPQATEHGAEASRDTYHVPEWLHDAPKEWRSEFDGSREGYAVLFDYEKRSLLVELCKHPGFFNTETNRPINAPGPQCERLLTAHMLEFTGDNVIVRSRDGDTVDVDTVPLTENGMAKLGLRFERHHMTLIPGQTNDLVTDIVSTPEMQAEFQQFFEFQQQQMRQQRAQMTAELHEGLPSFTVPPSVIEANEAVREKDAAAASNQ